MSVSHAIRIVGNVSYYTIGGIKYVRIKIAREDNIEWGGERRDIQIDLAMEEGELVALVYPRVPSAELLMRKDLDEAKYNNI